MTEKASSAQIARGNKARFWARMGLSVREGITMHQVSGQMTKGPDTWRNVPEHCLVQVARTETLGRWVGLPDSLIAEMKVGSVLHDYHKKQEITATRQANQTGTSPLAAVNAEHKKSESLLKAAGFNDRIIRLATSAGGLVPQLVESHRILDKPILSDDDWAYLIVHYVDDCSIGADWVIPTLVGTDGKRVNIIDYRANALKANSTYSKISQEVTAELLAHPVFGGMTNLDAWSMTSHRIEQRLAQRISERTGEAIDPLTIPELVDQRIREAIKKYPEAA